MTTLRTSRRPESGKTPRHLQRRGAPQLPLGRSRGEADGHHEIRSPRSHSWETRNPNGTRDRYRDGTGPGQDWETGEARVLLKNALDVVHVIRIIDLIAVATRLWV